MSLTLIQYVLTAAVRDRLLISLLVILILGGSLALFLGSSAVIEKDQFAIVFAAGGLRFAGVAGLVLFAVFFIRRSFESRDIDYLLSRPIGRLEFIASYAMAFSLLALLMTAAQGLAIYAVGPVYFGEGHWLWIVSVLAENVMMIVMALFLSMLISSASTAAMLTFAFYILARMMGQILGILDAVPPSGHAEEIMVMAMQMISAVSPRLDLMGQTSWLIYGYEGGISFIYTMIQMVVFGLLVLVATMIDLVKRQF